MKKIKYLTMWTDAGNYDSKNPKDWMLHIEEGYLLDTAHPLAVRKNMHRGWIVDDLPTGRCVRANVFKTRAQAIAAAEKWEPKVREQTAKTDKSYAERWSWKYINIFDHLHSLFMQVCEAANVKPGMYANY